MQRTSLLPYKAEGFVLSTVYRLTTLSLGLTTVDNSHHHHQKPNQNTKQPKHKFRINEFLEYLFTRNTVKEGKTHNINSEVFLILINSILLIFNSYEYALYFW